MLKLFAGSLLFGAVAYAGSFVSDFSDPNQPGYTLNQATDSSGNVCPVVISNALLLLYNENGLENNSFVLDDLDTNAAGGIAIDSFTATFYLQIGPGSNPPADGFAFVFGPDVTSTTAFSESGPVMPEGGVAVGFITYAGDTPGIGVNVKVAGDGGDDWVGIPTGGFVPMSSAKMVDSLVHKVTVQVNRNGTLDMVWNGKTIFTNLFLSGWSPVSGQFAFGGRNGGDSEEVLITHLTINTVQAPTNPPAPIVTSEPKSVTIIEGTNVTFTVGFDGEAPITFQWTENQVVIPNATNSTLVLTDVSLTNNGAQFACTLSNAEGSTNSTSATLTVIPDTTPPTIASVEADETFTNVIVTFSKPVSATALVLSDYKLNQGVTVLSATRVNQTTVTLGTSELSPDTAYILTVSGVQDLAATPNTIAPNTQFSFASFTLLNGTILHKVYFPNPDCPWYNNENGVSIDQLLADPRYPNNPDRVDIATSWVWPPFGAGTFAADTNESMFYDSLEGYFYPPGTGDYVFYTCGDDEFYLFLSTNSNPANMQLVAEETGGWGNYLEWETPVSTAQGTAANGSALSWNTASFASTQWPTGNTITLTNGEPYYMIMFHHDHSYSGGDQLEATYEGPDDTNAPADGTSTALVGGLIGFVFSPAGSSLAFSQQPQSTSVMPGARATFSAAAAGTSPYGKTVTYQWQTLPPGNGTTWTNIPGATGATFTTPVLSLAANGAQYRVIASLVAVSLTSSVATVTVGAAATQPTLTASALANGVLTLTFTGTLQSATNVAGPYVAVPGATSPFTVTPQAKASAATTFYRAAQ